MRTLDSYRSEFPITEKYVYLTHIARDFIYAIPAREILMRPSPVKRGIWGIYGSLMLYVSVGML